MTSQQQADALLAIWRAQGGIAPALRVLPDPNRVTLTNHEGEVWLAQFAGLEGRLAPAGVAPTPQGAINNLVHNFETYFATPED